MSSTWTARCSPHSTTWLRAATTPFAPTGWRSTLSTTSGDLWATACANSWSVPFLRATAIPLFDKTYADFRKHYMEHNLDTTTPYPGIMDLLSRLKERNKKVAVVSNKFYAATQALCRHFFGDLVDVAIGERENIRKKPAPDTVEEALRQLDADRVGAVYIGDSDVDIMTARNCQMPCISVLWGFRDKEFLVDHGATTFVHSPEEIFPF